MGTEMRGPATRMTPSETFTFGQHEYSDVEWDRYQNPHGVGDADSGSA
jgi:hypothetical protein